MSKKVSFLDSFVTQFLEAGCTFCITINFIQLGLEGFWLSIITKIRNSILDYHDIQSFYVEAILSAEERSDVDHVHNA